MSTTEPSKGDMLSAIERERTDWEALLAEVGERRMTEPGAFGDWTFKDLVAHLGGWRAHTLARLEAAAWDRPEPATPWPADLDEERDEDTDAINAWIYEQNRDRLLGDVIDEARQQYARLAEIVQMLPDEALTDPQRFPWLEGQAVGDAIVDGSLFSHWHDEHEAEVRAWLAAK
ncbi:MAG TPA: ClbS/DfsB family four-helix bundle protein [Thermomicrobiales bacterium]|jgi:hypothetical protein|nr:ClbS/DfsB family four-helix bundle protein [Thermomicrobiales bacterium]